MEPKKLVSPVKSERVSSPNSPIVEDKEDVYHDQWLLIFEAIKKFKINQ